MSATDNNAQGPWTESCGYANPRWIIQHTDPAKDSPAPYFIVTRLEGWRANPLEHNNAQFNISTTASIDETRFVQCRVCRAYFDHEAEEGYSFCGVHSGCMDCGRPIIAHNKYHCYSCRNTAKNFPGKNDEFD